MASSTPPVERVLFAAGGDDPFIEAVERSLALAMRQRGGQLLRVVHGRRVHSDEVATIDLHEAVLCEPVRPAGTGTILAELGRIVEDTIWCARTERGSVERGAAEASLIEAARHIDYVLDSYQPDVVLVWNGLVWHPAVAAARARRKGIPVWHCEKGALPGTWYADPLGINATSSLVLEPSAPGLHEVLEAPLPPDRRAAVLSELDRIAQAGASAWEQPELRGPDGWRRQLAIPDGAKVLFFPLQVDADTNMRFFSPHFAGSLDALEAVVEALQDRDDWFVLVKPHPKGTYRQDRLQRAVASRGRCTRTINLHDAVALASLVVTINSTVAAEAAWRNRPVLQLGRGILSGKRIVFEFDPARPLAEQIDEATKRWADEADRFERALRLYHFLRSEYLLDASSPADARRLLDRLERSGRARLVRRNSKQDAHTVARSFRWKPAAALLETLRREGSGSARRIVLLGYGQNARRILRAAQADPATAELRWSAWDDDEAARRQAAEDGLELFDPWTRGSDGEGALLVVTPDDSRPIMQRLDANGRRKNHDYFCLRDPGR